MQGWHLGLGLLSIGRAWGVRSVEPPPETAALALLEAACAAGIRFLDTAPAYGSSERILGKFLHANPHLRPTLTIATKMGEQWDAHTQTSHVSHTYDALSASLDASLRLLERIDVLQVHKATTENITSPAVLNVLERARSCGIRAFGASVSDPDTARLACRCGYYQYIQFPFNTENTSLQVAFDEASGTASRFWSTVRWPWGKLPSRPKETQRLPTPTALLPDRPHAASF